MNSFPMVEARRIAAALAVAALCAAGAASSSSTAATGRGGLTLFTVASGAAFINQADDRTRGASNNPFDAATNKLRPKATGTGNGPFAGDIAVYSFDLYASRALKKSTGSASYTCYFNYAKRALCQAYYELSGGTLTAAGPVDFNKTGFRLVVTGGTRKYLAERGQVTSAQAAKNAQRVYFQLLG
jgi:hypothetical protein